ncbi:GAF domain-containing protein [Effusibacillus consociatus]|uniref:GAF domain-containing protein n=1 Tax=Effusibacillus consociatus TaxID=1117041 RepID=A0ABV9PYE4_9BACL
MPNLKNRYSATLEVLIGLALMIAFIPAGILIEINPQPFFIVILYGALVSGAWVGVLAGVVSSLLFIGLSFYATGFSVGVFKEFLMVKPELFIIPVLFLLLGYLVGEIRVQWQRRLERLEEQTRVAELETEEKTARLREAEETILELQGRILGQTATMSRLYQIAQSLNVLSTEKILTELMGVLEDLLAVQQASIYRIEENRRFARLVLRKGDLVWQNSISLERSDIWQKIFREGKVLTFVDFEERPAPIYAVPIHSSLRIYAVIVIHRLPKIKVNPDSKKLLSVLADWAGSSLDRANAYEQANLIIARFPRTIVLRPNFFHDQLTLEHERFQRFGIPYTVLQLSVKLNLQANEVPAYLTQLLTGRIRTWDLVTWEEEEKRISFLMPGLDKDCSPLVQMRIIKLFDSSSIMILSSKTLTNEFPILTVRS